MKTTIVLIFVGILLIVVTQTQSKTTTCTPKVAKKALRETERLHKVAPAVWVNTLYDSFKKYKVCEEDSIDAGYSTAVNTLMRKNWKTTPKLVKYMKKDPQFTDFIYTHALSDYNTIEDIEVLKKLAVDKCPRGEQDFCKQISQ